MYSSSPKNEAFKDESKKKCSSRGEKKKLFQVIEEKDGEKVVAFLKGSEEGEKKEKVGVERRLVVSSPSSLPLAGGRARRRSLCGPHVELSDVFASNGVKVISVDMPPFMQIHAVECARKTHDSMEKFTSKTLALTLKKVIIIISFVIRLCIMSFIMLRKALVCPNSCIMIFVL